MSNREASLQELLISSFQSQMNNVHTAIPCIVIAVRDSGSGAMVDIQPTVNQKFKDNSIRERPQILGVPVSFPVSSTAGVLFPIKVGTTGTAIFSMRGLDIWKSGNGKPSTPNNASKFDKADALFFPGIQPPGMSIANPSKHTWPHSTDDVVVFNNIGSGTENEVRLEASGNIVVNTNQDTFVNCNNATITAQANVDVVCANFTVDASESISFTSPIASFSIGTTSWTGAISQSGNYTGVGVQTFNGVIFSTHRHAPSVVPPSNP